MQQSQNDNFTNFINDTNSHIDKIQIETEKRLLDELSKRDITLEEGSKMVCVSEDPSGNKRFYIMEDEDTMDILFTLKVDFTNMGYDFVYPEQSVVEAE